MNSFVSIFEIPATDLSRAIAFYQAVLDLEIEKVDIPGMQMGLFPAEEQANFGVIVQGDDYKPSAEGITIYLNAGMIFKSPWTRSRRVVERLPFPKLSTPMKAATSLSLLTQRGTNWVCIPPIDLNTT